MGHLPTLLGLTFFWAVLIVGASIVYAFLQLIFEMVDLAMVLALSIYAFCVGGWRRLDPDDWVGLISLIIFMSIACAVYLGVTR